MRKVIDGSKAVAVLAAAILTAGLAAGCTGGSSTGRLKVAASTVPMAYFCRQVGGDRVDVETIIPPNSGCGHTFEPSAGTMEFLSEADLIVVNGLGLESWAADVMKKVARPDVVEVVAASDIPKDRLLSAVDEEEGGVYDPHVWLDPMLAVYEVEAIRDGLVKADPSSASYYRRNAASLTGRLKALDAELAGKLSGVRGGAFIATHPTWIYFARRYGLVQVGEVEEIPGREPSAAQIAELVDAVRKKHVKAVLAEPQLNPKALEVIARDAGPGVKVVTVDPIGDPGDPKVGDYFKMMRYDAGVLQDALR